MLSVYTGTFVFAPMLFVVQGSAADAHYEDSIPPAQISHMIREEVKRSGVVQEGRRSLENFSSTIPS